MEKLGVRYPKCKLYHVCINANVLMHVKKLPESSCEYYEPLELTFVQQGQLCQKYKLVQ